MYVSAFLGSSSVKRVYLNYGIELTVSSLIFVDTNILSSININPARDFELISQIMDYSGDWGILSSFESPHAGDIGFKTSYNRAADSLDFGISSTLRYVKFNSLDLSLLVVCNYAVDHSVKSYLTKGIRSVFSIKSHVISRTYMDSRIMSSFSFVYDAIGINFSFESSFIVRKNVRFWENLSLQDTSYIHSSLIVRRTEVSAANYPIGSQHIQVSSGIGEYKSDLATVKVIRIVNLFGVSKRIAKSRKMFTASFGSTVMDYCNFTYATPALEDAVYAPIEVSITRDIQEQAFVDADNFGIDIHFKEFNIPKTTALPLILTAYDSINREIVDSKFFEIIYSMHTIKRDDNFMLNSSEYTFYMNTKPTKLNILVSLFNSVIAGYTEGKATVINMSNMEQYGLYLTKNTAKRAIISLSTYPRIVYNIVEAAESSLYSTDEVFFSGETLFGVGEGFFLTKKVHGYIFNEIIYGDEASFDTWRVSLSTGDKTIGIVATELLLPEDDFEYTGDIGFVDVNDAYSEELLINYSVTEAVAMDLNDIISNSLEYSVGLYPLVTDLSDWMHSFIIPERHALTDVYFEDNFSYFGKQDLEEYVSPTQKMYVNMFFVGEDTVYYFTGDKIIA